MRQLLITIGREYGSGGKAIGLELGKRLGLPVYDKNILEELHDRYGFSQEFISSHEERPVNPLISRKVRGFSNSVPEVIAERQFELIREKADSGESFIMIGRCGEHVLKDYEGRISFFILADYSSKLARIMERLQLSKEKAAEAIKRMDRQRRSYHNYYCDGKWGDSRYYDLCINSSSLGIEKTADLLEQFIRWKTGAF